MDGVHKGDVVRGVPVKAKSRHSKIIQMGGVMPLRTKIIHTGLTSLSPLEKPVAVHVKGNRVN